MPRIAARIAGEAAPRGLSVVGDHIPLIMTLAALPSMPRWQLARIANRAIECIDLLDGDSDLEPGDEPGSPSGWVDGLPGDPEDAEDNHDAEAEQGEAAGAYGMDQREVRHFGGAWRAE